MARNTLPLLLATLVTVPALADSSPSPAKLAYPSTRTVDVADDYHGVKVADPYRWLEDLESKDTASWVAAQNALTFGYLEKLPQRQALRTRLTELWDYRRTSLPVLEAGQIWFAQNSGLQRQASIYRQSGPAGTPMLVLDPNALSPDGSVQVATWSPSPDGRYLAYTLAKGGSDVQDVRVRDLKTGQDLPTVIHNVMLAFSTLEWSRDGGGFLYTRYRNTEREADFGKSLEFHQVWYHMVGGGTPDRLVFERPEHPKHFVSARFTDDGRWLHVASGSGSMGNSQWIADLGQGPAPDFSARPLAVDAAEDAFNTPLGVVGDTLYLHTTHGAPRGRIVAAEIGDPDRATWRTVVSESKDAIAEGSVAMAGDRFVVGYLADVQSRVRLFALDGKPLGEIALPETGSVAGNSVDPRAISAGRDGRELFLNFTSFLRPTTVLRYEFSSGRLEPFHAPQTPFDASKYETRAQFYS